MFAGLFLPCQLDHLRIDDGAVAAIELYKSLLDDVALIQQSLKRDQERFVQLLALEEDPTPANDDVLGEFAILRDGLCLRLRELDVECRRLSAAQRRTQRLLDEADEDCELETLHATGVADPELLARAAEQRRVIWRQDAELDQAHFERDVLADETARLRETIMRSALPDPDDAGEFSVAPSSRIAEVVGDSVRSPSSADSDSSSEPPGWHGPAEVKIESVAFVSSALPAVGSQQGAQAWASSSEAQDSTVPTGSSSAARFESGSAALPGTAPRNLARRSLSNFL